MAASKEQELGNQLNLKLDSNGLITAVTVDADTREVLMVAFMNKEALEKTMATGKATYWSRSRQKFWVKGEESGNTQQIVSVTIDCDQDAVVLKVRQKGAACHNGFESCFYRQIVPVAGGGGGGLELKTIAAPLMDPDKMYKKS
ncbi:MAG: phosphoribosyl-AMP cyclohydrolase [Phycisphaerales bacterium]|nr:phosphoribosyl-AMP cyclohydrolase [Phycisphaerales bacterium]